MNCCRIILQLWEVWRKKDNKNRFETLMAGAHSYILLGKTILYLFKLSIENNHNKFQKLNSWPGVEFILLFSRNIAGSNATCWLYSLSIGLGMSRAQCHKCVGKDDFDIDLEKLV